MKSTSLRVLLGLAFLATAGGVAYTHCEIPCGIYGDQTRIALIHEDITTIEKSMKQIHELSGKSDAQSVNQTVRWIANKDHHADKIQETVTQYFMTQRVKATEEEGKPRKKYLKQITALHAMLVSAMKCKQTVDAAHVAALRSQIDRFSKAYFSEEDLKHVREHHGGGEGTDHK